MKEYESGDETEMWRGQLSKEYFLRGAIASTTTRTRTKNPRKLKGKQHTNYPRSEEDATAIEKNPGKDPPAIVFFCSGSTLIQSRSILSC